MKIVTNSIIKLPTPSNISLFWNFGRLLGLILIIQLLRGLFLSIHYYRDSEVSFYSVRHIMRDVNYGWEIRIIHANGARIFFLSLYIHVSRGLYYASYTLTHTWIIGVTVLLLTMATAFLGYVLPWGQISFWGATVITNLFSAIPILGLDIVYWLWGGFAVGGPTLSRFFGLHFLLPFIITGIVAIHLLFLHQRGSSNPLGVSRNLDKLRFHPYFSWKDIIGALVFVGGFFLLITTNPWLLGDTENFIPANPLATPIHIQPEWYFLFAYAILRSIPNKLGGVVALALAVLVLYLLPLKYLKIKANRVLPFTKLLFWWFINCVLLLTWIGARPVEAPYLLLGQLFTIRYFFFYLVILI